MRKHLPLGNSVCCIGVACALGSSHIGSASGPAALLTSTVHDTLRRHGLKYRAAETINPHLACATPLFDLLARLADATHGAITRGERPLVIGGDHAIAAGTWKGIARALGRMPGLIWIDAHLDAHVPATSPSGNLHGMPVAALLAKQCSK